MLELTNRKRDEIHVSKMNDGDIAIITQWGFEQYIGRTVQRYKSHLLVLGEDSGKGWSWFFIKYQNTINDNDYVRILKKGEVLVVGEKL